MADKLTETVERLRELFSKGAPETDSGWFIHCAPTRDGLSVIVDGCSEGIFPIKCEAPQAKLIVEAVNALPDLLASLSRPNVDEMREALEPFARAADLADERMFQRYLNTDLPDDTTVVLGLNMTLGHIRQARAALRGSADNVAPA